MSKALNSNVKRVGSLTESPAQKHYDIFNHKSVIAAFKMKTFVNNFVLFVEVKVLYPIPG